MGKMMKKKYALIIGIENYPAASGQQKVKYAKNDATEMANYARRAGFDLIGYGPILNKKATYSEVIEWLDFMFHHVTSKDFVFLYFAGHGYYSEFGGYLIPYDYNSNKEVNESTCVSFDSINMRMQKKKPAKFVLFLDTCHSGFAVKQIDIRAAQFADYEKASEEAQLKVTKQIRDMAQMASNENFTGRVIFTSSSPHEPSIGIDEYEHGLYTYFLLECLKSESHELEIDIEKLINFTKEQIRSYSIQHQIKQTPVAYTNIQGKFCIPTYKSEINGNGPWYPNSYPMPNGRSLMPLILKTLKILILLTVLITAFVYIDKAFIGLLNDRVTLNETAPLFKSLGKKMTVSNGSILRINERFEYSEGQKYWICFIDGERIWPMVEVSEPEIKNIVAVPKTGFYGGRLVLIHIQNETSERFNNWLRSGSHNPLKIPGELSVILETKIIIK
jgi:hypothetical protein